MENLDTPRSSAPTEGGLTAPIPVVARPRNRFVALAVAIVAAAALLGSLIAYHYAGFESTDDAQLDGHINQVAARVPGTVLEVSVNDNETVAAGAVLVRLDPRDYEVALARAKADFLEAEATEKAARTSVPLTVTTTTSQVAVASSDVDAARERQGSAEARLREAEAGETNAVQDLERFKALVAKDEISRQEFDAAVARAKTARAAREAAAAAVQEASKAVGATLARLEQSRTAPEQVEISRARASSAEARVAQARAALDQAQLNLDYTTVKSPVAGVVSRKSVEVGQILQAGQPLLAVIPLEEVWVTANFKESQLLHMKAGQAASVSVDAYGGKAYRGHVDSIAAATGARFSLLPPENATGNYVKVVQRIPVKIVIEPGQDPSHLLRPGMSVLPTVYVR